jgi:eukaryotic-like serine/threonine-protein kinase
MNCPQCTTANPDFAENCSHCGTPMPISDTATIRVVDPTALSAGSDFGTRYRIEALLGQGGMGRVYKAYDKTLDRMVALKVVRQGMMADTEALNRFKQELLLASKISHTNILRIHDMGEVGDVKFITMAFVDGPDLHHILKENPKLAFDRVVSFSQQLAAALAAAQAEGVVHRDLKPQNILVGKDDHLYVSDFGLARSFEETNIQMTRTGAFLGTPRYMSPEQVEGKPADTRSDIYAYGLILYEMVTGDVPFTGESTLKVMYQRIQETPKSPKTLNPDLPNWFVQVIMRCLERDPATRYQRADEIVLDLQGARSTVSTYRGGGGATRTVQIQIPEFRDKRWIWGVIGVAALFVVMFAVPQVRHLIFSGKVGKSGGGSGVSGVPPIESGRYVAVLPLQVLGDPTQLNYLAQGIQEALSTKLFQSKVLHVSSAESTTKIDQNQPLSKIAGQLGANLLVQGTLQGSGDKIRIILKLEDVIQNKQVWTQQFDGVTGDLFTLEDEIYNPLVAALNLNPTNDELAKAEARPTENVAAYDLYLRGRNSLRGHDEKSFQAALDFFDQALKNDGTFALAYTGIADASLQMYQLKKDSFWTQKALAAAQQAQQLNDNLPEVHATLGSVYSMSGRNAEAIAQLKRAVSLAPDSDADYRRLGSAYLASGDGTQAIEAYQKAIQLNAYYWDNQNELGGAYYQLGNYPKALEAFQQVTVLEPDIDLGFENVGNIYLQEGKYQDCIPYFQKALQIQPFWSTYSNLGTAYFFLKEYPNSVDMFEKAVALNPNNTLTTVNLADGYRAAGQSDKARATYEKAISLGFKELQTNPQNAEVIDEIALSYAKIGNAHDADSFIRRARALDKNNVGYIYDQAKISAILGRKDEALKELQEAFEKHFPAQFAAGDSELENIQSAPEFRALIGKYSSQK